MNTDPITLSELAHWASAEMDPEAVNPTIGEGEDARCAYTLGDKHCVAGQFLTDTDRYCPAENDPANTGISVIALGLTFDNQLTENTLMTLQRIADGTVDTPPQPWGQAWQQTTNHLLMTPIDLLVEAATGTNKDV